MLQECKKNPVYSQLIALISHQGVIDAARITRVTRGENERKTKRARCKSTRSKPARVSHLVAGEPTQSFHGLRWRPKLATLSPRLVSLFSLHNVSKRAVSSLHVLGICTLLAVILQRSYICLSPSFSPRTFSPVQPSHANPNHCWTLGNELGDRSRWLSHQLGRSTRFEYRQTYARVRVRLWNLRI